MFSIRLFYIWEDKSKIIGIKSSKKSRVSAKSLDNKV